MIELNLTNLEDLARGTAFLATGGGGDPYIGKLMLKHQLEQGKKVKIISPDEIDDDTFACNVLTMGAPTVFGEKAPNGLTSYAAMKKVEEIIGKKFNAIMPIEAGGVNATLPLVVGALSGLPVIDADGMGRAFPELQMVTYNVGDVSINPLVVINDFYETGIFNSRNSSSGEWLSRAVCVRMGGICQVACYPMNAKQIKETSVHNTIKLSFEIGSLIQKARDDKNDPVEEIIKYMGKSNPPRVGKLLFTGKIDDLLRETVNGWTRGKMYLKSLNDKDTLLVEFQNEFSYAKPNDNKVLAMVPDLICALDSETGEPITTDSLRYGQRIKIVAVSVPPIMRSEKALKLFGPRAFGLPFDYTPLEDIS